MKVSSLIECSCPLWEKIIKDYNIISTKLKVMMMQQCIYEYKYLQMLNSVNPNDGNEKKDTFDIPQVNWFDPWLGLSSQFVSLSELHT